MSLFYADEHITCYNYMSLSTATFKGHTFEAQKEPYQFQIDRSIILFAIRGEATCQYDQGNETVCRQGQMILIPRCTTLSMTVPDGVEFVSCSFAGKPDLCNCFSFNDLTPYVPADYVMKSVSLPIRENVQMFLDLMKRYLADGLSCIHMHQLKLKELFILLRAYYTKEELATFFYPVLSVHADFKDFVLDHYTHWPSVEEFASLLNMSVPSFNRKFKEVFGEPAHRWLIRRKAELIYKDVVTSNIPFAEIADRYKMNTANYLVSFCRSNFGKSPSEMRQEESQVG